MCESEDQEWAFYVACYLLSLSTGQSVAGYISQSCCKMVEKGEKGMCNVMGVGLAGVSEPVHLSYNVRLKVELCLLTLAKVPSALFRNFL